MIHSKISHRGNQAGESNSIFYLQHIHTRRDTYTYTYTEQLGKPTSHGTLTNPMGQD